MKSLVILLTVCVSALLSSCGGGGTGSRSNDGTTGTTTGAVALAGQTQLATFAQSNNGALSAASGSPLTATGVATACVGDPANAFVIVAYDNSLATSYQVSATTGSPTQIQSGLIVGTATAMAELGGKLVYVAENNAGLTQFSVFALSTTGGLQSLPNQITSASVSDVAAHPNGQLLVASLTPGVLQTYRADAVTGALTKLIAPLQGFGGGAAHSMGFAQNGAFLLVAEDVATNPVDVFSVDATSGALVRLSTVLNLSGTQLLAPHPNGSIVYAVANSSVTPVLVDANGVTTVGTTTQIPGFTASAATVDRSGANLFVTGTNGAVASFAINATTGALTTNNVAAATVNFAPVCVVAK